ncbi:hypothetical protein FOVG_19315, partial [Fusarium oxysporum f. sp. pisi HDV247]
MRNGRGARFTAPLIQGGNWNTLAGKEIDKNRLLAQLARENTFLGEKLASKEPAGQKAVDYCPDKAFARMLEIIKVRDKAKKVAE